MPDLLSAAPIYTSTSERGKELDKWTKEGSDDVIQVSGAIFQHTQAITGKGLCNYDPSDDEDNALTYTLNMEEVKKVAKQQYVDFSAIFQRHPKNP